MPRAVFSWHAAAMKTPDMVDFLHVATASPNPIAMISKSRFLHLAMDNGIHQFWHRHWAVFFWCDPGGLDKGKWARFLWMDHHYMDIVAWLSRSNLGALRHPTIDGLNKGQKWIASYIPRKVMCASNCWAFPTNSLGFTCEVERWANVIEDPRDIRQDGLRVRILTGL